MNNNSVCPSVCLKHVFRSAGEWRWNNLRVIYYRRLYYRRTNSKKNIFWKHPRLTSSSQKTMRPNEWMNELNWSSAQGIYDVFREFLSTIFTIKQNRCTNRQTNPLIEMLDAYKNQVRQYLDEHLQEVSFRLTQFQGYSSHKPIT